MTKKYRAEILRDDHTLQDWSFYDVAMNDGALLLRCSEDTETGQYETILAAGTWREIRNTYTEGEN